MEHKNHKPQVKVLDITAETTNNDHSLSASVILDNGYDELIGVALVEASRSFANYAPAASNISEVFELTLNHQDGEICKDLPIEFFQFDSGCPVNNRHYMIDTKEAKGKRVDIVLKKNGTAKDNDSDAIGGTVTSTYKFKLVLLLRKNNPNNPV